MLTLREAVELAPVHIFYLGTEAEFLDAVLEFSQPVRDANQVEFTSVASVEDLITALVEWRMPPSKPEVAVAGLVQYMKAHGRASYESIVRQLGAVCTAASVAGVEQLKFADTEDSDFVDSMLGVYYNKQQGSTMRAL